MLLTALTEANGKIIPTDARKKIVEGGGVWGKEYLDNFISGFNGQVYGTNLVNIAQLEARIAGFNVDSNGSASIDADVRPGTIARPAYCDNLVSNSWTDMISNKIYAAVNSTNFGGFQRISWTNLPATTNSNSRYWKILNEVYDSTTTNGLSQIVDGGGSAGGEPSGSAGGSVSAMTPSQTFDKAVKSVSPVRFTKPTKSLLILR